MEPIEPMDLVVGHEYFMKAAYHEATKALDAEEVPIGAVIVYKNRIIGKGYNRIEAANDATAHAEVLAIGAAATALSTWRLNDCTIYITLEPCLMCIGAILQSRIDCIVYGVRDSRYGAVETYPHKDLALQAYRRFPQTIGGVLEPECKELIQTFFKQIRKKD